MKFYKKNVSFEKIFLNLKKLNNKFQKITTKSTFRKKYFSYKNFFENMRIY